MILQNVCSVLIEDEYFIFPSRSEAPKRSFSKRPDGDASRKVKGSEEAGRMQPARPLPGRSAFLSRVCRLPPWKHRHASWAVSRAPEQNTLRESVLFFRAHGEGCIARSTSWSFPSVFLLTCSHGLSGQGDQNPVRRTCGSGLSAFVRDRRALPVPWRRGGHCRRLTSPCVPSLLHTPRP